MRLVTDEDWAVLCQARQAVGDKEVDRNARKVERSVQEDRSKGSRAKNCWSGQSSLEKDGEVTWKGLEAAFNRRSELRESPLDWSVDIHKTLRIYQERRGTIEGSDGSWVSFDRVDDPWLSLVK